MTRSIRPVEDPPARILVVDDDEDLRKLLGHLLEDGMHRQIDEAASAAEARTSLSQHDFDLVITDLSMPGEGGVSLMQWAREHRPGPSWIVLTGHGTFDSAVKALQLGAFDFLSKPIRAHESLRNAVQNALAQRRLLEERDRLHGELEETNQRLREHVDQLEEACRLLEDHSEALRADLRRAGIIQQALLPREAPCLGRFHVRARYRPSQNVGGDLYDVIRLDERHVALLVADAAGHGLAAAMLTVLFRSQLPLVDPDSRAPRAPRDVLRTVNRSLCATLPAPGLFLTVAYCLLDTATGEATIASAGHPPLLWLRRKSGIERIFHTGPALGLSGDADFAHKRIALEAGDRLFFYSDGLYERFAAGQEGLVAGVASAFEDPVAGEAAAFGRLFASPTGSDGESEPREDDVTVLMLVAAPGASLLDNGSPPPPSVPEPSPSASETLVGVDARYKILSINGRGDWTGSAAFHAECRVAIDEGHDVMLDLTLCSQLDSTFLGTIHQLCELADEADVEFRLQGVAPTVESLFDELGMRNVIDHIVPCMLPLPTRMESLGTAASDRFTRAQLLLQAHEGLAALSERNRKEFDPLLTQLRKEMEALPR
jgi:serine phosphatase RsbU (regulator of sigma subunit)/anti-anti-sigma regulatory factor